MSFYGLLSEAVFSAARPYLCRKYDEGNEQRYGNYPATLPRGAVWIHAVSVGEVQSAYPFVKEIKSQSPDIPLLLSTITKTGKVMSEQLMGDLVNRIYYPWDAPSILEKTLKTLAPRAYITCETEIWPGMLEELQKHSIPAFLVNGRLSQKSFKKYCRLKSFWRKVIRRYTLITARSEDERSRFIALGADEDKVKVTGDCKVDALINRRKSTDVRTLDWLFDENPVVLAGSTHEGEDPVIFDAYSSLLKRHPSLKLIVAPRHPERAESIIALAENWGMKACLFSNEPKEWKVLVIDRIGVLFSLYTHVKAAFIGGSLVQKGGQNVMEPAIWGVPCCQGPDYHDFTVATEGLMSAGLCKIVHGASDIVKFFDYALKTNDKENFKKRSEAFFDSLGGASRRNWELIQSAIEANGEA